MKSSREGNHYEKSYGITEFHRKSKILCQGCFFLEYDLDLISGRYVIDAKSLLGIFSLDLSKPIELTIHADEEAADEIIEALRNYLA